MLSGGTEGLRHQRRPAFWFRRRIRPAAEVVALDLCSAASPDQLSPAGPSVES
jgi:hypothetical protein